MLPTASGVIVVAEHFWQAKKARDALRIDWDPGPNATLDNAQSGDARRGGRQARASALASEDVAAALKSGNAAEALKAAAKDVRGRLPAAAGGARDHGADELYGRRESRSMRRLCRHPGPADGASGGGRRRRD